jgi:hypothetical protein
MSTRCTALAAIAIGLLAAACAGDDEEDVDAWVQDDAPNIDASPDGPLDASALCATCGADEICVQFFDGTCGEISLACKPRHAACVGNACSAECMQWQCNAGSTDFFFRCDVGGCAGVAPGALACYGP